jgi:hypothetical protein
MERNPKESAAPPCGGGALDPWLPKGDQVQAPSGQRAAAKRRGAQHSEMSADARECGHTFFLDAETPDDAGEATASNRRLVSERRQRYAKGIILSEHITRAFASLHPLSST